MAVGLGETVRNARAQAFIDKVDTGTGNGTMAFYGGGAGRPATGAAITDQVLLGTVTFSDPCATISAGVITLETVTDDSNADADGTIEWARIFDKDGTFVADMGCGSSGSGQEIIFNTLAVLSGGVISIVSGTSTEGDA